MHIVRRKVPATIATMITSTMESDSTDSTVSCSIKTDDAGVEDTSGVGSGVCASALGCGVGCGIVPDVDKRTGNDDGAAEGFGVVGRGIGSAVVNGVGVAAVGAWSGSSVGTCVSAVVGATIGV